jgi:hypothetical protein
MTNHQYGPKGHIVDAFLEHLKEMTDDELATTHQIAELHAVIAGKDLHISRLRAMVGRLKAELEEYRGGPDIGDNPCPY